MAKKGKVKQKLKKSSRENMSVIHEDHALVMTDLEILSRMLGKLHAVSEKEEGWEKLYKEFLHEGTSIMDEWYRNKNSEHSEQMQLHRLIDSAVNKNYEAAEFHLKHLIVLLNSK